MGTSLVRSLANRFSKTRPVSELSHKIKPVDDSDEGLATQIFLKNKQIFFAFFAWEQEKWKKERKRKREKEISKKRKI